MGTELELLPAEAALVGRVAALEAEARRLRAALVAVGVKKQFPRPCYCRTVLGWYCVGQEQCNQANAALEGRP